MQANSYSTPSGSQGFGVHHDTHDVLVLQVAGEKRWRLYDPLLELPLKHQRYSSSLGGHGPPTDDFVLRAGDTLYLPRGWLHEAETSQTDSLHLTIGIAAHTWLDAARGALAALEEEPGFRHDVARGEADGLEAALAEQLDPEAVERRRRRRFVETRRPIREDGALAAPRPRAARPGDPARATRDGDRRPRGDRRRGHPRLRGQGDRLPRARRARAPGVLRGRGAVPGRPELPGELDADGRLVLARRLVREGFLRVVTL